MLYRMTESRIDWESFFRKGRRQVLARGDVVHTPHEKCRSLGLVESGSIRLARILPSGREVVVRDFLPGDLYGELLVFNQEPYPGWLTATAPSVIREISLPRLLEHLQNPEALLDFMRGISRKMIHLGDTIEILSLKTVKQKIAHVLLTRPSSDLPSPEGNSRFSVTRFAGGLGCSREAVSRALGELRREGLVTLERNSLVVSDPAGLEEIL